MIRIFKWLRYILTLQVFRNVYFSLKQSIPLHSLNARRSTFDSTLNPLIKTQKTTTNKKILIYCKKEKYIQCISLAFQKLYCLQQKSLQPSKILQFYHLFYSVILVIFTKFIFWSSRRLSPINVGLPPLQRE